MQRPYQSSLLALSPEAPSTDRILPVTACAEEENRCPKFPVSLPPAERRTEKAIQEQRKQDHSDQPVDREDPGTGGRAALRLAGFAVLDDGAAPAKRSTQHRGPTHLVVTDGW